MLKFTFILILLFSANSFGQNCECSCKTPDLDETTHEGGNKIITVQDKKVYKFLHGKVFVGDEPLSDVLIEIFDQPEWIINGDSKSPVEQNRIAACKTGKDGSFCFKDLPPGKYELRASKDIRWNPIYIYVIVDPNSKDAVKDSMEVRLSVGS